MGRIDTPGRCMIRRAGSAGPAVMLLLLLSGPVWTAADDSRPIIRQTPFDLLTLRSAGREFRLVPLALKPRRPVAIEGRQGSLLVQLQDRPEQQYQIKFSDIRSITLYEQLVMEQAQSLVDQNQYDKANEYYDFLLAREPKYPGLAEAKAKCMFREAEYWESRSRYDNALAVLLALQQKMPRYPGLKAGMTRVVGQRVAECLSTDQTVSARRLLEQLDQIYPGTKLVADRRQDLLAVAQQSLAASRAAESSGKLAMAYRQVRAALDAQPDLAGAASWVRALTRRHPMVRVAVHTLSEEKSTSRSWSSRRDRLLEASPLAGCHSFDVDGMPRYRSSVIQWRREGSNWLLQLPAHSGAHQSTAAPTIWDVVSELAGDGPGDDALLARYWDRHGAHMRVRDEGTAVLSLDRPAPLWPSMLAQMAIRPTSAVRSAQETPAPLFTPGPYAIAERETGRVVYAARSEQTSFVPTQPHQMILRRFDEPAEAIDALRNGQVDVIDRLMPWQTASVGTLKGIRLLEYGQPTMHLLLFHPDSPWMRSRHLRRAVRLALDRPQMLRKLLGGGGSDRGRVVRGLIPRGEDLPAGSDGEEPNQQLAAVLLQLGSNNVAEPTEPSDNRPPLTLVYGDSGVTDRVVPWIAEQLGLSGHGWTVELSKRPGASPFSASGDEWDLWYLEWPAMDPALAALELWGPNGIYEGRDGLLTEHVNQLLDATTRSDVLTALNAIRDRVEDQQWIVPLWSLDEFAAVAGSVEGLPGGMATLFQEVQAWHIREEP